MDRVLLVQKEKVPDLISARDHRLVIDSVVLDHLGQGMTCLDRVEVFGDHVHRLVEDQNSITTMQAMVLDLTSDLHGLISGQGVNLVDLVQILALAQNLGVLDQNMGREGTSMDHDLTLMDHDLTSDQDLTSMDHDPISMALALSLAVLGLTSVVLEVDSVVIDHLSVVDQTSDPVGIYVVIDLTSVVRDHSLQGVSIDLRDQISIKKGILDLEIVLDPEWDSQILVLHLICQGQFHPAAAKLKIIR